MMKHNEIQTVISINSRGFWTAGANPYFRHARTISMAQRKIWQIRQSHVSNFDHWNVFANLCALHVRYPACRSAISVSLDCLKDDRASKFIPSLEIDVIHRGAPGDIRRIRTTRDVIPFNEYNLSLEVLDTELSNNKVQHVINSYNFFFLIKLLSRT